MQVGYNYSCNKIITKSYVTEHRRFDTSKTKPVIGHWWYHCEFFKMHSDGHTRGKVLWIPCVHMDMLMHVN